MFQKWLKKHLSTAGMVCAMRGALAYDDSYPMGELFRDKYAATLCGRPWAWAFLCPPLSTSLLFLLYRKLVPGTSVLVIRAYYMESQLESYLSECDHSKPQYVLVAAGMDSFLLRKRSMAEKLSVFEIDLPEPQKTKKSRLKAMGCQVPRDYHFVTADLFSQSLIDALVSKGFDSKKTAFYSIMGLIYYLPKASFLKMIEGISQQGVEGSVVVLDYLLDDDSLDSDQLSFKRNCTHIVDDIGERFLYETSTDELVDEMKALGFYKVSTQFIQDLYGSSGLSGHPTAGPNCFALGMFRLKKQSSQTKTSHPES